MSMASIDKDGKISNTSCCGTPPELKQAHGDVIYRCVTCDSEVTVLPKFSQKTPEQIAASKERRDKAKRAANKSSLMAFDRLAMEVVADIEEEAQSIAEDQCDAIIEEEAELIDQHIKYLYSCIAFMKDVTSEDLAVAMLNDEEWLTKVLKEKTTGNEYIIKAIADLPGQGEIFNVAKKIANV
jgi:hypothetical protein